MRPFERWHTLWQFFIALDEEWSDEWPSEEAATDSLIRKYPTDELVRAVREWHDAFDDADDAEVERIVRDFNPSYDPAETFSGAREWAYWVRAHLERELAGRRGREDAK